MKKQTIIVSSLLSSCFLAALVLFIVREPEMNILIYTKILISLCLLTSVTFFIGKITHYKKEVYLFNIIILTLYIFLNYSFVFKYKNTKSFGMVYNRPNI